VIYQETEARFQDSVPNIARHLKPGGYIEHVEISIDVCLLNSFLTKALLSKNLLRTQLEALFSSNTNQIATDLGQIRSDDNTITPDSPLITFRKVRLPPSLSPHLPPSPSHTNTNISQLFEEAGKKTGCTFEISGLMGDMISSAGFINRVDTTIKTPIGGWAQDPKLRELGMWALLGFDRGLEGYTMATLTRVLGVCCSCYPKYPDETANG
jgi:hypothetical protein